MKARARKGKQRLKRPRIQDALKAMQAKGFVKPCGKHFCRQCNPKTYSLGHHNITSKCKQTPSRFTRITPYPSPCVAERVANTCGCKLKDVNRFVLQNRLKKMPHAYFYFMAYKMRGVTSMRKMGGGGGFNKICRDFTAGVCTHSKSCRFLHPGTFQLRSVYQTLPLNWPPVPHVGRLDVPTEGLLLFTDDGRLQSALLEKGGNNKKSGQKGPAPSETCARRNSDDVGVEKAYLVQVVAADIAHPKLKSYDDSDSHSGEEHHSDVEQSIVNSTVLHSLTEPLAYEDGAVTAPARVKPLTHTEVRKMLDAIPEPKNFLPANYVTTPPDVSGDSASASRWIRITIEEGRNRQVRRLCARAGLRVLRLVRWSFGPLTLRHLGGRVARPMDQAHVHACYRQCGLLPPQTGMTANDDSHGVVPRVLALEPLLPGNFSNGGDTLVRKKRKRKRKRRKGGTGRSDNVRKKTNV